MQTISIDRELLKEATKNQFFTVEFIKKDGTLRKMNCRTGVKKHLNPNSKGLSELAKNAIIDNNLLRVWEDASNSYKTINCDSIIKVSFAKKTVYFDETTNQWMIKIHN